MAPAPSTPVSATPPQLRHSLAVLFGALLLAWPALLNRYPLLYPDSVSYLQDGRSIARALFLHQLDGFEAMRSELYSLSIFPFHWNLTPWPVIALNALLTSWVLWLVVRSVVARRSVYPFLILTALLSLFTTVSWYVSLLMPDIYGPLLYLSIYLLVFSRETLSRREFWALSALAAWATTTHATHLMLAAGLCAVLALLLLLRWQPIAGRGRALAQLAALIALAAGAQMALHAYLYGDPSLNGHHPPYLMARIIADGPGATYLQQHCAAPGTPGLDWAICADVARLPDNDDDFLWAAGGVWQGADRSTQKRLLAEEMPLVLDTLRTYPRRQVARSFANFTQQLDDFGVNDFDNNDWMQQALLQVIPSSAVAYPRTLQARSIVPSQFFTTLQRLVIDACSLALVPLLMWLRRYRRNALLGLVAIVVPILLANAFVTAVLSSSDSRYQARIIWLIPLVTGLAALDVLAQREKTRPIPTLQSPLTSSSMGREVGAGEEIAPSTAP